MDIDIKVELMFLFSAHIVSSSFGTVLLQLKDCQEPSHLVCSKGFD